MVPLTRLLGLLVVSCALSACGSGFVALFSSDGSSGGAATPIDPPPPPTLVATSGSLAPLSYVGTPLLSVRLQDVPEPDPGAEVIVEIRTLDGAAVDRPLSVFVSATDSVEFFYDIPNIRALLVRNLGGAAFDSDVEAELAVLIDGVDAAPPLLIRLLKRPVADVKSPTQILVVSAEGTDLVTVSLQSEALVLPVGGDPGSVEYSKNIVRLNNLQATVAFGDLSNLSPEQAVAISSVWPVGPPGVFEIEFVMPRTDNPTQAQFTIDSFPAGRSTLVSRVFCRPVLFGTSPATGSTDGGTAVVLFGQAMIPADKKTGELQFDKIRLRARKGGRVAEIPLEKIRQDLSKQNQLVFSMPASPDGTPGPVRIEVTVTVNANPPVRQRPTEDLSTVRIDAFVYGDTFPTFGPRGARVAGSPAVVRTASFVRGGAVTVDALALTRGPLGLPYVGLFASRGNGMFVRFGDRIRAGNPEDLAQRNPVDLCIGQFTPTGSPAGVIINRATGLAARHSLVLGNDTTNPPLRFFESLPINESGLRCKSGYLNNDKVEDLVVLGRLGNDETPAIYLSFTRGTESGFDRATLPTRGVAYKFTALTVRDLDGDSHPDLVFAQLGTAPRVLVAYGDAGGGFSASSMVEPGFDLEAAGYRLDVNSKVIDIHLVGSDSNQVLAFVISGAIGQPGSPPAVAYMQPGVQPRTWVAVQKSTLLSFPADSSRFVASVVGDLTGDSSKELIIGAVDDAEQPLRVLRYDTRGLRLVAGAVDLGVEQVFGIKSLDFGLAAANGTHHQNTDRPAVFVSHEARVAGGLEYRVSTFLSAGYGSAPRLISPSPARKIEETVLGLIVGRFRTRSAFDGGESSDAWAAVSGGIRMLQNDGLGEISLSSQTIREPRILPPTLTRVVAGHLTGGLEAPAVLTSDGRIGMVLPVDTTKIIWAGDKNPIDLRDFAPIHLRIREVRPESLIQSKDLDGDGISDLLVLLNLSIQPGLGAEGECLLLLFLGLSDPPQGDFPYRLATPSAALPNAFTHGNSSAMVLGDFAIQTTSPNPLEVAIAVPQGSPGGAADGNHVRVYRYDAKTRRILRTSTDPSNKVWVFGSEPALAIAADYNGDGRTDLAVASRGDRMLRVLYNFSPQRGAGGVEVDLGSFQGAPANPIPFVGEPLEMLGADLNGDRVPDLVMMTRSVSGSLRDQNVRFFLSPGRLGGVSNSGIVPAERTGNLVKVGSKWVLRNGDASLGIGDLNGDDRPDLLVGWESISQDDYNLRVLFGTSF